MFQRALVVDDSLPIHGLIKAQLDRDRLEIHSAYSGESGLRMAAQIAPDVILLDVDLPGIDGFEVCRRLKATAGLHTTPVIFVTADFCPTDVGKGLGLGAAAYVTKPFKGAELADRVETALQTKRSLDEHQMVDGLTRMWNQRYLEQRVPEAEAMMLSGGQPTSCIMLDVDGMANINRRHGTLFGDRLLRAVGNLLLSQCRAEDVVSHIGGGQFAVLAAGQTRAGAGRLATRLCGQIKEQLRQHDGREVGLTCSFGVADCAVTAGVPLIERAEQALERAKENGGDCVSIARPARSTPRAAA